MTSPIYQGLALHQAGKLREAEQVYRGILSRNPNDADALHLLGVIATQMQQLQPALRLIESAIRIRPDVAFYHNNLGNIYRMTGELGAAEMSYRRALELNPDYVDPQANLGMVLREQARFDEALAAYERAIQMQPTLADAYSSMGTVLMDQGRIDEALAAYRRAMEFDPADVAAHSNLVYVMHDSDKVMREQLFDEHRRWGRQHAEPLANLIKPHANDRAPGRRLCIGYVSPDFRDHPVARFLWPMIEHRDRENFGIVCFNCVEKPDAVTARYRAAADEWHDVLALNDDALADLIRSRRIDVLVDLAGHTNGSRLLAFARRPAPVQVTFIGYPDTLGMKAIDLRITDSLADPSPESDGRHLELLARVDGCFLCYPLASDLPLVQSSQAVEAGFVTFGSFNNLAKISPATVKLWSDVLAAVPMSKMVIKATRLGDERTCARAAERFTGLGLPMNRVELIGPGRTQGEHLQQYRRIDIGLDTFPYNGTTTTCEALAMGVPVVSLVGDHHASRVGLSLLTAAGHGDWATDDPQRFVEIAAKLASDIPRLAALRGGIREELSRSTLCDGRSYAAKIERIYREAWIRWCHG